MVKTSNPSNSSAKTSSLLEELYDFFMENPKRKKDWNELVETPGLFDGPDTQKREKIVSAFLKKYPGVSSILRAGGGGWEYSWPPVVTIPYRDNAVWKPDPEKPGELAATGEDYSRNLFPSLPDANWVKHPSEVKGSRGRFLLVAVDLMDGMPAILRGFKEVVRFYKLDTLKDTGRTRQKYFIAAMRAAASYTRKEREELKGTPAERELEKKKRKSAAARAARTRRNGKEMIKRFGL